MVSIGKLREFAEKAVYADNYIVGSTYDLNRIADEIEREIAEKYMELPVDADGVPIHVGDKLKGVYETFEVCAISEHYAYWCEGRHWDKATECTHVKPDKLKERVRKFIHDRRELNLKDPQEKADRMLDEFCADIREMAKEGEL